MTKIISQIILFNVLAVLVTLHISKAGHGPKQLVSLNRACLSGPPAGRQGRQVFSSEDTIKKKCFDTILCPNEYISEYDFRSQSYTTLLSQGDTLNYTFIAYSKQDFRIIVCGEASLGNIRYKVVEPERKIISKVKKVNENEEIIYKLDEFGEMILGSDDKPVVLSKEILRDTIWDKTILIEETPLFDSENNQGKKFWDVKNMNRTKRLTVKIKIDGDNKNNSGCVNILVGRKYSNPFRLSGKH
ncbi:MAG: hypothetical protein HY958_04445 [Bacteroidia bacterium]|nr:hypothetical protein [Bacteroidia bacterium]